MNGDALQSAINTNAAGTTFCINAGAWRITSALTPKSNDVFDGQGVAILDGSKDITPLFVPSGGLYVAGTQTQNLSYGGVPCESGKPLCADASDLFLDGKPLRRVGSTASVVPGTFYFDHGAGNVYIADNPTGHKLEATVAVEAFHSVGTGTDGVVWRNLTVQHFASHGIQCRGLTDTVTHSTIRWNHGDGLQDCPIVSYSTLDTNGKDGYVFGGNVSVSTGPYSFTDNTVTGNNYAGFDPNYEAGGAKFMQVSHLTVARNTVTSNDGPGLWTDWENRYIVYDSNDVENNTGIGIDHEASWDATISNNTVKGNGSSAGSSTLDGAGIYMNDSQNVEMYGNYLSGNHNGIGMTQTDRGSTSLGPLVTQNVYVHDNTIVGSGRTGLVQWVSDGSYYTSKNNRFLHNSYDTGCDSTPFIWQDPQNGSSYAPVTVARWKADGQDTTGAFQATC